ncbi:MAG: ferrous iron transport protein A [Candidatus Omnitrophica bacterium]|nr:ferrous iron transport protein A [Candidatus Omnitrophota bacterium]
MLIDLTQLKPGKTGTVAEIQGGQEMIRKAHVMGVRPGKKIKKVSSHFWRGPQTVLIDNLRVAIGYGIAQRIFVEVER